MASNGTLTNGTIPGNGTGQMIYAKPIINLYGLVDGQCPQNRTMPPNDVRTTPFKGNLDIFKTCCNMTDTSQDLVTLSDTEHSENPLCWGYCGLGATEGYADLQNRREAFYECYETKTAELGRENAGLDGIMCFGDRKALNSMQDTLPDSGPPNKGGAPAVAVTGKGIRSAVIPGLWVVGLLAELAFLGA
ncbi:unnamed protein product [Parascedosporium putredinis]|uniref:Uncharacterized protein n=1 Tax=Parascedosporium putredinis TaxID=1442378 RepID=A0A9P1H1J0_9PEZI|nr:unnamed protein product [Parascedosporium putredinis]CAI7993783.1 unnamed protein product [Parascedosporium putredinis]